MTNHIAMYPDDLTPAYLTGLVQELRPGLTVEAAEIKAVKTYGDADPAAPVSTSARVSLNVRYGGERSEALPTQIIAKISFPDDLPVDNPELDAEFENEVNFYNLLRGELALEAPTSLGGRYDPASKRFIILMEDLTPKAPHFNSMMGGSKVEDVRALLDTFAVLHATYWDSPRFATDLDWVQNQLDGPLETLFDDFTTPHIAAELEKEHYKREFVQELETSGDELYRAMKAVKLHQSTLTPTFLHGDAHFGNTYTLPDGRGGLLDWQICCKGFVMHDIGYFIQSALCVEDRRKHERDLLDGYREALGANGVRELPGRDMLWNEYRLSAVYGFYMGWLTVPRQNYGLDVAVLGNHRTKAACLDLDSVPLIRAQLFNNS